MKIGELVRCPRCNSENPPEYRFCGMCGTPLDKAAEGSVRSAEPVRPPERTRQPESTYQPSQTLSGPSFLGLSQPARGTEDVTYLFEEEQPRRTYWRFLLLLLILGIVGGLGYLQYTRSGKSWTAPWANQKPAATEQASQQPPPPTTPSQNAAQPPAANQQANGQAPAANAPGNPPQPKETDIAPGATAPAGAPPAAAPPTTANGTPAPSQPEQSPPNPEAKKESQPAPDNSTVAKNEATDKNEAAADQPDTTEENPKPKSARVKPAPVPATNPDDALVANAEKYLYGRGVAQNCDRALVSLRAAADRQNPRAQTLLGTMYGTGHCVPRDLPNAYRWFALASRQQSDNMWIQRNLEMIWREMTPQERQLAMQSNR